MPVGYFSLACSSPTSDWNTIRMRSRGGIILTHFDNVIVSITSKCLRLNSRRFLREAWVLVHKQKGSYEPLFVGRLQNRLP